MASVGEKDYIVNYYEVDTKRRATVATIINYFQDIATVHSEQLGLSIDRYNELKVTFVLQKWEICFHRLPVLYEKVHLKTYPVGFKLFYAYRLFELYDSSGEIVADAASTWFLIDIEKRRPLRIPPDFYSIFQVSKDPLREGYNNWDLKKELFPQKSVEFRVRHSDLDTNNHVNNVRYVEWALEAIPENIWQQKTIKELRVIYEQEISYGEWIRSECSVREQQAGESRVVIDHVVSRRDGACLTRVESVWE